MRSTDLEAVGQDLRSPSIRRNAAPTSRDLPPAQNAGVACLTAAGIDVLPDEILQHVLGFLPAQEAVRTCVLAQRWRYLWRSVPALRITSKDLGWYREDASTLKQFVNNLLVLRNPDAQLDVCEFGPLVFIDESHFSSWIQQALHCKPKILRVDYGTSSAVMLPNLHLINQHLTTLELYSVEVTDDFSSFLALKSLRMRYCDILSGKVSSLSLKQLAIIQCDFRFPYDIRVQISTPNVDWLELSDNYGKTPVHERMPSLVKAFVRIGNESENYCGREEFGVYCSDYTCEQCVDNTDATVDCVILKGLSKAESLELIAGHGRFIFKKDLPWCPIFSNLKTLLLNWWCVAVDIHDLIYFLQHTPVLEKLTLQLDEAPENWVEMEESHDPSNLWFASMKLKVVEVMCKKFDKRVKNIFTILSTHGVSIEQFNMKQTSRWSGCFSFEDK